MAKPKVSVVVVDYEGERYRNALLESLFSQSYKDYELIIVDNSGNIDLSRDRLRENISIHNTPKNLGFSEGCNYGALYAKGEWIAFLNDDTLVDPNWLGRSTSNHRHQCKCHKGRFRANAGYLGPTGRHSR